MVAKKNGRPTIMTPEVIEKLEEAFAWGCTDIEACLWADIGEKTLYNYQEKTPGFVQRKERLKQTQILKARQSISSAMKRDPNLALKYLERKAKAEFSLRTETDLTTKGESISPYALLSLEELKKLAGK